MIDRRYLLQAALALPLIAAKRAPPGVDWNAWFKDWMLRDFGMIGYYADDNAKLLASKAPVDIVFMGDSITEGWMDKRPGFFSPGRIDRGIGGQTSSQMVLRMMSDVVALRPKAVHIMAGTNDIAGNTGPMTPQMTQDNIRAMVDIAQRHGIRVLLAPIPPASSFPWRAGLETRKPIAAMNAWLRQFARDQRLTWVDYRLVLDDGTGAMKPGLASDGVHPTEAGYDAMATVIEPVLRRLFPARHA
ncbi:MAG TPA: GDSL-type esterase/lipase family protein [Sphingomicrobium sp.]